VTLAAVHAPAAQPTTASMTSAGVWKPQEPQQLWFQKELDSHINSHAMPLLLHCRYVVIVYTTHCPDAPDAAWQLSGCRRTLRLREAPPLNLGAGPAGTGTPAAGNGGAAVPNELPDEGGQGITGRSNILQTNSRTATMLWHDWYATNQQQPSKRKLMMHSRNY